MEAWIIKVLLMVAVALKHELKDSAIAYWHAVEQESKTNQWTWWQKRRLFLELMRQEAKDNDTPFDWLFSFVLETVHSLITSGKWADKEADGKLLSKGKDLLYTWVSEGKLSELFKTK